ncbi:hypothetical protein SMC26_16155 [Actinomadura fulvescens]|uniref:Integral membrane protein n=1 Tax=Actinomadura fulvescens TaxID=46160 RepID=A0ABN3QVS1_9ACTN
MSGSARLTKAILRLYPAERHAELASTMQDTLAGQSRAGAVRELADLTVQGLRERSGLTATSAVGAVVAAAAPFAAASAISISLVFLVFAERSWRHPYESPFAPPGPFDTLGPYAYALWLLVAVASCSGWARAARLLMVAAVVMTAALVPLARLTGWDSPPLIVLGVLVAFGVIALAAPPDPIGRPPLDGRVTVISMAFAALLSAPVLVYFNVDFGQIGGLLGPDRPLWYHGREAADAMGVWIPALLVVALIAAVACMRWNVLAPFAVVLLSVPWCAFAFSVGHDSYDHGATVPYMRATVPYMVLPTALALIAAVAALAHKTRRRAID